MTGPRHYVFAGGGSGGHLTPAVAVAEQILAAEPDARVTFLTSGRAIDEKVMRNSSVVCNDRVSVVPLPITQPPSIRPSRWPHLVSLGRSIRQCRRFFQSQDVSIVVGSGAFASVPGLLAAHRSGIPTVVFEANLEPGRVNRWWAPRAALRLAGFPGGAGGELRGYEYTGMPLVNVPQVDGTDKRQILIVGGSQGSRRLNMIVAKSLGDTPLPRGWTVLHQTGVNACGISDSTLATEQISTMEFIPNVMEQMAQSAFVISRAGAVTVAEMAATGCPGILIPLSSAADRHQQRNAQRLADHGAGIIVDEAGRQASVDLSRAMSALICNSSARASMSRAMRSLHQKNASVDIARRLRLLAENRAADAG